MPERIQLREQPARRPSLAESQARFGAALRRQAAEPHAAPLFAGSPERILSRLALYRGNIVSAVMRAMEACYPVSRQIVGDEFFEGLVRAYWTAYPSATGDLGEYGGGFGDFIAAFRHTQSLPYLGDVARLEWRVHRAYQAADHDPLPLSCLADLDADGLLGAGLKLQDAVTVLASDEPMVSIWRLHQSGAVDSFELDWSDAQHALVYRRGFRVEVEAISAAEFAFLDMILIGRPLTVALAAALREGEADLEAFLLRAFERGLVVAIDFAAR